MTKPTVLKSYDGKFKVGDVVKGLDGVPFEVKDIINDNFGSVLMKQPGGYGYDSHYCEKVKRPVVFRKRKR